MLPQFCCQDGYFVSHIPGKVSIPEQSQVNEFLPPYKPHKPLNPKEPYIHGPQIKPNQGPAIDLQRAEAHLATPAVIKEVVASYNEIMGRNYSPFLEEYRCEDADIVIFIQGGHARTCRFAVDQMREQGIKIGMVKIRFVRPWPTVELAECLAKYKAVGVVETSTSYGGATKGGTLLPEVRASLYELPDSERPLTTSFMAGLGGEVVSLQGFRYMAKTLTQAVEESKTRKPVQWIGFEPDWHEFVDSEA
jgi:pyruvate ferredoxin oxidoreductase alpha subunit/oxalate oxidoreductase subunit alpha